MKKWKRSIGYVNKSCFWWIIFLGRGWKTDFIIQYSKYFLRKNFATVNYWSFVHKTYKVIIRISLFWYLTFRIKVWKINVILTNSHSWRYNDKIVVKRVQNNFPFTFMVSLSIARDYWFVVMSPGQFVSIYVRWILKKAKLINVPNWTFWCGLRWCTSKYQVKCCAKNIIHVFWWNCILRQSVRCRLPRCSPVQYATCNTRRLFGKIRK